MTKLPPPDLSDLFTDRQRTLPWLAEEFIRVSGYPLVYTAIGGEFLVRLPGGRSATVAELKAEGRDVVMPRRIRCGRDAGREL